MENVAILRDLLLSPIPTEKGEEVAMYISDGEYIDYISVTMNKSGILRAMGLALKKGYRVFAVYSLIGEQEVKLFEMDSEHMWISSLIQD